MIGIDKKVPLFSFLLVVALILVACAGGNNAANSVEATEVVPRTGEDDVLDETTEAAANDVVTETPAVQETAEGIEGIPEGTADASQEVVVGNTTPVAGQVLQCNPYRLSNVLDYRVVASDAVDLGDINAVVVQRAANRAYGMMEGALAGEEEAAEATVLSGVTVPVTAPAPVAGYIVVDLYDDVLETLNVDDGDMLLPFSAIQMNAMGAENDALFEDGTCGFSLSLASADLRTAPVLENDAWTFGFGEEGWNNEVNTFAQSLGLAVPTLGEGVVTNTTVFTDGIFDQIDMDVENLEDEELGEIEDFIIDPQTGTFRYGVLETGEILGLGGKRIAVPMSHILWVNEDEDMEDSGEIILPAEQSTFENVPDIGDLGTINFADETWDDDFETYWPGLEPE